jgi:hypothetical protein
VLLSHDAWSENGCESRFHCLPGLTLVPRLTWTDMRSGGFLPDTPSIPRLVVNRLPAELLSRIFALVRPDAWLEDGGDLGTYAALRRVCKAWDFVMRSDTILWNMIPGASERQTGKMLSLSRTAPLRISIIQNGSGYPDKDAI